METIKIVKRYKVVQVRRGFPEVSPLSCIQEPCFIPSIDFGTPEEALVWVKEHSTFKGQYTVIPYYET